MEAPPDQEHPEEQFEQLAWSGQHDRNLASGRQLDRGAGGQGGVADDPPPGQRLGDATDELADPDAGVADPEEPEADQPGDGDRHRVEQDQGDPD